MSDRVGATAARVEPEGTPGAAVSSSARIPWPYLVLISYAAIVTIGNVAGTLSDLPRVDEAHYGDSYVWYTVRQYVRTGTIYQDFTQPPYAPSIYSPILYVILSLPARWLPAESALIGARLLVLASFVCCVALAVSITQKLMRCVVPWPMVILLVLSVSIMSHWPVFLRADFMGIAFSLLAVKLLIGRGRRLVLAGVAAGMAFLFKLTLVAAIGGGFLWLVSQRRFAAAVKFAAAAAISGLGGYLLFALKEPHMLNHLTAMREPVMDYRGAAGMWLSMANEPVILLGFSAVPFALHYAPRAWQLLLWCAGLSLASGTMFVMQAGANSNYFYEFILLLIPAAAAGLVKLHGMQGYRHTAGVFVALWILLLIPRQAVASYRELARLRPGTIVAANNRYRALENAMRGERIFSTVSKIAILTDDPPVTEPFLMRFLELKGKFDTQPLAARIRNEEFAAVVGFEQPELWRGVEKVSPSFTEAIESAYVPFCRYGGLLFRVPRGQTEISPLGERLRAIGCVPVAGRP